MMSHSFFYLLKQQKTRIPVTIICLFTFQLNPLFAFQQIPPITSIILTNTQLFSRINEVISINRNQFPYEQKGLVPIVKYKGKICVTQFVENDKDTDWNKLLIEVTIPASSTITLQVNWVDKQQQPEFIAYTNVRMSLRSDNNNPSPEINRAARLRGFTQNIAKPYYQMEGPGIENDKVAFRFFFDSRNGKDIYGKIVDTPVLEKVGVGASWHEMQPWGMDILKVGNSLGAGALAVQEDSKIYPLADADTSLFETLYEGPLQASFRLTFKSWDVGNGRQNGSETITLTKGNYFYKNDVVLTLKPTQKLIVGIAHFGKDLLMLKKHNYLHSSISTYGIHTEANNSNIGLAILFPASFYDKHQMSDSTSSIPNTSYVSLSVKENSNSIYFFAGWEKTDSRYSTQQGFDQYLRQTAQVLANPIQIKVITKKR